MMKVEAVLIGDHPILLVQDDNDEFGYVMPPEYDELIHVDRDLIESGAYLKYGYVKLYPKIAWELGDRIGVTRLRDIVLKEYRL